MANLKFANTHNMVTFLAKPAKSKGFEQIVDFLNAHTIKYSLIYTLCIKQFWATVKAKTVNGEVQLQALVDGKKIIITETIVRRDLQLEDADEPNGPITNVENEAVNEEMDHSLVRAATIATSFDAEQYRGSGPRCQETIGDTISQTRFKNVSKHSNNPLLARGNTLQSGEDSLKFNELMELCINLQQRVLDLETTKTTQATEITSLKRRVKKLERRNKSRTHGLKRLYRVGSSRRVESSEDEGLGEEDASKQGRIADIDANKDIYLVNVQTDEDMFGVNDLDGDEVIVESVDVVNTAEETRSVVEEVTVVTIPVSAATTTTTTTAITDVKVQDKGKGKMVEPEPVKKMSKKELLRLDEELAFKLQAEEEEERLAREKA
ncbi:hypothetical protein Tco_0840124 [Tanacetum coccineum]|uniref:Xylulose kinase-1 n=1 Tax=Tanacetum coccineum TaxID=301880 RepID=A0ABQ5AVA4_9ASTR